MSIELRGIIINNRLKSLERKLVTRNTENHVYRSFLFPNDKEFTRKQIVIFLGKQLSCPLEKIIWPVHIDIPKEGGISYKLCQSMKN